MVSISLTPKLDKNITQKENQRAIFFMNIDGKCLKFLAKQIQQYILEGQCHVKVGVIPGMQSWLIIL